MGFVLFFLSIYLLIAVGYSVGFVLFISVYLLIVVSFLACELGFSKHGSCYTKILGGYAIVSRHISHVIESNCLCCF